MLKSTTQCLVISAVLAVVSMDTSSAASHKVPPEGAARPSERKCSLGNEPARSFAPVRALGDALPATTAAPHAGAPCSPAEFATLSGKPLVAAIADGTRSCIDTLWDFDADVESILTAENVTAVVRQARKESLRRLIYAPRIERLLLFYQIAAYHEFYQPSVDLGSATKQVAQRAIAAIGRHRNFFSPRPTIRDLREQWTRAIDGADGSHLAIGTLRMFLTRYVEDRELAHDPQERAILYNVLFTISRQIYNNWLEAESASVWYGLLDPGFVDLVAAVGLDTGYEPSAEYVVNNAIWALGRMSYLDPVVVDRAHQGVTQAFGDFPLYTAPWLWAVTVLEQAYAAELHDGTVVDVAQIREDVTAIALPRTDVRDGGALVFRSAVTESEVFSLYDSMQEVEAQFFRKGDALEPTPGDPNETLTLVIYASPAAYALYQPFLFGLPTDNGGIYIESAGTLYTYDREPTESAYTLDELLRHEFVHYLDSRYLIHPSFGDPGSLYDDGRLVWYNEGLAEYLVGSTRVQGVLPRQVLLDQIAGDGERLTIAEIVDATYSDGFTFYRYAGMLFEFLERRHPDHLYDLFVAVRSDDVATVDAVFASLAGDPVLQLQYDVFLDEQVAGFGPYAEDVPTVQTPKHLPTDNSSSLSVTLESIAPGSAGTLEVLEGRFRYTGLLALPLETGNDTAGSVRSAFERAIDDTLLDLSELEENFPSAVGWFGALQLLEGEAVATYVIEGPYSDGAFGGQAPAPPSASATTDAGRSLPTRASRRTTP